MSLKRPFVPKSDVKQRFTTTTVYCQSSNMAIIERRLQGCLDKLVTCADENGFKFSPTKTLCVHFCKKNGLQPEPNLKLYGQQLPVEEQVKFLGLFFDKKLSFIPHIKYMKDKCRKALQLLRVISSKDWGGDRTTLLRIYRSHIRSKLDYGCIVYGSARRSYLAVLDPIANQGLRLCSGAFRTSPIESLQVETGEPSLETRRLKLSLQYYMKMKANPENPAYSCVVNPEYKRLFNNKPGGGKGVTSAWSPLGNFLEGQAHPNVVLILCYSHVITYGSRVFCITFQSIKNRFGGKYRA